MKPAITPAPLANVKLTGGLLAERQRIVLDRSIAQQYHQCKTTGRLDALRLIWKPGLTDVPRPHEFWDSDIAKWIESAAYSLMLRPDPQLEDQIEAAVDAIAASQRADGYFNSHFLAVEPDKIFTNLRDKHELYCAGHLIEAAVAYYQATGNHGLLDVMIRYVDCIALVFGNEPGKKNGYDGHEEIELALVKLYRVTNNPKHLALARHFIDARGTGSPHFFDEEAHARGDDPKKHWATHEYYQAHVPIRKQKTIEGHSVRALYMLCGAIDVAYETGDRALISACKRLFDNCVNRRMYVNGGVGSTRHGERFTYDFDLPNESAYAETCANIALVLAANRLANHERDGRYADVVELALYNAILPGLSLDGSMYFYANYLATDPRWHEFERGYPARRQEWFGCACCPPNIARLLASLGSHVFSCAPDEIIVNLYCDSTIYHLGTTVTQTTNYPWDGKVTLAVDSARSRSKLTLRVPGWCDAPSLKLNGRRRIVAERAKKGYVTLMVRNGDVVQLELPMPVRRVYADPRVRHNNGRVALFRGPLLYCLEQADNGPNLNALTLPRSAKVTPRLENKRLGGVVTLGAIGSRDIAPPRRLYSSTAPRRKPAKLRAIPYYAWANRTEGEMLVWIREGLLR